MYVLRLMAASKVGGHGGTAQELCPTQRHSQCAVLLTAASRPLPEQFLSRHAMACVPQRCHSASGRCFVLVQCVNRRALQRTLQLTLQRTLQLELQTTLQLILHRTLQRIPQRTLHRTLPLPLDLLVYERRVFQVMTV